MSETCWEPTNIDISHWAPWCRFFETSHPDNHPAKYFVIDADLAEPPGWITTVIRRPTAVFYCGPRGEVTDLDADHAFPPMTTPEQAIALMGYHMVDPPLIFAQGSTGPEGSTAGATA